MPKAKQFHIVRIKHETFEEVKSVIEELHPQFKNVELPISFYVNYALKYFINGVKRNVGGKT